jgi:hypothetical protein
MDARRPEKLTAEEARVDALVADYLAAEASRAPTRSLVERVRATRRRRRRLREGALWLAAAALLALGVGLGVLLLPNPAPPPRRTVGSRAAEALAPLRTQGEALQKHLKSVAALAPSLAPEPSALRWSAPGADALPPARMGDLATTFKTDAAELGAKAHASLRAMLERAGIVL